MDIRQMFEIQTNDSANPTFILDYETEELVFVNASMEKRFQLFEDYVGKKPQEIIPEFEKICGYTHKTDVVDGECLESSFFSQTLNTTLRTKVMLWESCGKKFLQTKYFLAPNTNRRKEAEQLFERAIGLCLEILSDSTLSSPVDSFLEVLGKFYCCEKAYICEFDREKSRLINRHLWKKDETILFTEDLDKLIKLESLINWLETDYSKSIVNLDKTQYYIGDFIKDLSILEENNLHNVTMCKLWNKDGTLMGFLALGNRAEPMYDDRLLQAISHFVMEQFNHSSMQETLEEYNDVDILTGFYNRKKYAEKVEQLQNEPPECLGVLFINMNGLRETNEFLGYEQGDVLLKKTSSVLMEYFNSNFYRISGDEFIGFVEDCGEDIFEETVNSLQDRLKNGPQESSFSFGHSWQSGNYVVAQMIKVADAVMLINKQAYYSEAFQDTDRITDSLLQDLFKGIAEDEFMVYLQPQVDLKTNQVTGAEALIRRYDKTNEKMIFPDQFIAKYEENSIIRHVDLFVVRKTCQLLQEWKQYGVQLPISVNLSRVTLMEHGIVQTIYDILQEYQVEPQYIIIEVTERIGIIENEVASSLVDEFKEKGFKLSLDDFGCAYSNIVTLASISVDEVKLDKSLVDNILVNGKNAVIVESLLSMCLNFEDTHTLAEGIETQEQADFLRDAHCHLGQGYLYSRPIPTMEFFDKYVTVLS